MSLAIHPLVDVLQGDVQAQIDALELTLLKMTNSGVVLADVQIVQLRFTGLRESVGKKKSDALRQAFSQFESLFESGAPKSDFRCEQALEILASLRRSLNALHCLGDRASKNATVASTTHRDEPLAFRLLAAGDRCSLNDEDSWLITSIAGLSTGEGFAAKLLASLRIHNGFAAVDRICLAQVAGLSNQIFILDQAMKEGIACDMVPGYSCWVNPQGSLFQLSPDGWRIFSSARTVVSSFLQEGLPPQRSIRLLADSGFESGLALPLYNRQRLCGILFLNSLRSHVFDELPLRSQMILSLVSKTAREALSKAVPLETCPWEERLPQQLFYGQRLSGAELLPVLELALETCSNQRWRLESEGQLDTDHFLVSPGSIAVTMASALPSRDGTLRVGIKLVGSKLHLTATLEEPLQWSQGGTWALRKRYGSELSLNESKHTLSMSFRVDRVDVLLPTVPYSL